MITKKYVLVAKRGPLKKILKRKNKYEGLESALVPDGSIPLRFLSHLAGCSSTAVTPVAAGTGGHLGLTKNSGGNGSKESGIPSGTFA